MPGTYLVGRTTDTFVDRTRPTQKNGSAAAKPQRTLRTLVLYPVAGPPSEAIAASTARPLARRWPLVVFSHGSPGLGTNYLASLQVLASAGYVVAAPDYPLSKAGAEGGSSEIDVPEQSQDIGFVIDQMVAASDTTGGPLHALVDPHEIGIAGHSLGAITSLDAGFRACCADRRIDAVAAWAGIWPPFEPGDTGADTVASVATHRPLLVVHGTGDTVVGYRNGVLLYRRLGTPKYLVTLPGAGHGPPFFQGDSAPQSRVAVRATVDFFDRYLKHDAGAIGRLHALIAAAGPAVATEQQQTG